MLFIVVLYIPKTLETADAQALLIHPITSFIYVHGTYEFAAFLHLQLFWV